MHVNRNVENIGTVKQNGEVTGKQREGEGVEEWWICVVMTQWDHCCKAVSTLELRD